MASRTQCEWARVSRACSLGNSKGLCKATKLGSFILLCFELLPLVLFIHTHLHPNPSLLIPTLPNTRVYHLIALDTVSFSSFLSAVFLDSHKHCLGQRFLVFFVFFSLTFTSTDADMVSQNSRLHLFLYCRMNVK